MLLSGTVFATIIPLNETQYKVQLYVNNPDIATIETGDLVKYNIAALPINQYGMVDGYVTSISQDTMIQNGEYSGYYLVEATIDNVALSDKDGNTGRIGVGMQVEAKIVTQQKTIARYLLEKKQSILRTQQEHLDTTPLHQGALVFVNLHYKLLLFWCKTITKKSNNFDKFFVATISF